MDPLILLYAAWDRIVWTFAVWIPSWWDSLEADVDYIRHIGD